MIRHLLVLGLMFGPASVRASDPDTLIQQGLQAEAALDSQRALDLFLAANEQRPADPFILQKISRQYSDSTFDTPEVSEKKQLVEQALDYAQRAHELKPGDAVCTLSLAICYGKLGLYADTRTRINYVRLVKDYAELARHQDPNYDWAYHVLGRWHAEVSQLGKTKRFVVSLFYGGLPDASTGQAVELLQRAVELSPREPAHHIELGFAYLAEGEPTRARQSFAAGLALPSMEKYDEEAKQRARSELEKLSS